MKHVYFILFAFLFFCIPFNGRAQDRQKEDTTAKTVYKKHKQYVIVMNDGTEYTGEILEDNGREMLINVPKKGKIYIPKYVVKSVELLSEENFQNNEYLNENSFPRYYMMGTNALPFQKRQFTANMYYFLSGSANYDVNERYSLGITTTFWGSPIALNAKTSFEISPKNYAGVDIHGGTVIYSSPGSLFGHLCGKYTHGTPNSNFTLSGGLITYSLKRTTYPTSSNGMPVASTSTYSFVSYYMSVAAAHRLSKTNLFVGEFLIFPNNNFALAGIGLRSIKKETSSFVFGFYNLIRLTQPSPLGYPYYGGNNWTTSHGFYYNNRVFPVIPIPYLGLSFKL